MILEDVAQTDPNAMSALGLAFVGDGVYELLVRSHLAATVGTKHAGELHRIAVGYVCARAQSAAYEVIANMLTDEEQAVYHRGRNANSAKVPKNADVLEYRRATGMEALFGYLYLKGDYRRVRQLFETISAAKADVL